MVAREASGGKELWRIPWKTNEEVNACDPTFVSNDSQVYITSQYGFGRSLFDVSGPAPKELWSHGSGIVFSSPVYVKGKLYAFNNGAGFGEVDLGTGKKISRAGDNGSSVIVLGEWFLQVTSGGRLRVGKMVADGYAESHAYAVGAGETWNAPAYWDGKLFLRNKKGDVFCSQISK